MIHARKVAVVIPAYNEEKLITKTITTLPKLVDIVVVINDGSSDKTGTVINKLAKKDKRVIALHNKQNMGLGSTMVRGYKRALETDADLIGIVAGDAQCSPEYLEKMTIRLVDSPDVDYVKANRFVNVEALQKMPRFRRFGNILITIMTKFSTGYYSLFDALNSFGMMRRAVLEDIPLHLIGKRYDFESTQLVAMSIAGIRIVDYPVPALYGDEKSTINVWSTSYRILKALWSGFWRRIYYKYVLKSFHPIALFLYSGLVLTTFGLAFGIYIVAARLISGESPSTASVMISVVPFILGFQLILSAFTMDIDNEKN